MNARTILLLGALAAIGLLGAYAMGCTKCGRAVNRQEKEDISRWEDEGGTAPEVDELGREARLA
jgi:hypothetical protein